MYTRTPRDILEPTKPIFTCSKSRIEALEKGMQYLTEQHQWLCSVLHIFHTFLLCFYCLLWTSKCWRGRILKPLRLVMFTVFGPHIGKDVRYSTDLSLKLFSWLHKYWSIFKLFYLVNATTHFNSISQILFIWKIIIE